MVDYHRREKHITLRKKNITRGEVEGDILFPECDMFSMCGHLPYHPQLKAVYYFIILNASSKENFEFLLESVNQWDTLCTYHYLNKATTTIILASNIFINNNRRCYYGRGCHYRKWLIGKTRTERLLFSGSAREDDIAEGVITIWFLHQKSYWGMPKAYYPKYNKKLYCTHMWYLWR